MNLQAMPAGTDIEDLSLTYFMPRPALLQSAGRAVFYEGVVCP
jgi:hypothetical protein